MLQSEIGVVLSGKELVAAMPGIGGGVGVVRPYGLGIVGDEREEEVKEAVYARGALGGLGFFGYEEASPLLVKEAYTDMHKYADLRRERDREQREIVYCYAKDDEEEGEDGNEEEGEDGNEDEDEDEDEEDMDDINED
jgi:hypothetical protein